MTEGGTQQKNHTILIEKTRSTASAAPANGDSGHRAANASLASGSTDGAGANMRIASTPPRTPRGKASRWGEHEGSAGAGDSEESGHEFYELPSVFVSNADRNEPVKVRRSPRTRSRDSSVPASVLCLKCHLQRGK